ncbi:hypothetical protein [Pseudonocardia pini]|uniref:hypothetical protein n=1 Tax=Pseudonocardia pini TaxID=2758030 RepID=UPI0015F0CF28|nr:hypothetical protein [Pseudonocardia pini]
MTDQVVDASVVFEVLAGGGTAELRRRMLTRSSSAPELVQVEVLSVLRRAARRGTVARRDADAIAERLAAEIVGFPVR